MLVDYSATYEEAKQDLEKNITQVEATKRTGEHISIVLSAMVGSLYIALNGVLRPVSTAVFVWILSYIIDLLGSFAWSWIDSRESLKVTLGVLLAFGLFGGFAGIFSQAHQFSAKIQLFEAKIQTKMFEKNVLLGRITHVFLYLISVPLSYSFAVYLLLALISNFLDETSKEVLRYLCYLRFDFVTYDQTAFMWYGVVAVCGPIVSVFWRYYTHPLAKKLTLAGDLRS